MKIDESQNMFFVPKHIQVQRYESMFSEMLQARRDNVKVAKPIKANRYFTKAKLFVFGVCFAAPTALLVTAVS